MTRKGFFVMDMIRMGSKLLSAAAVAALCLAAAAPAKRSWMGPVAGLAAGLGLAALMSHLGMGEAFANFLMLALLGVAAVFLIAFLMRRFGRGARQEPALASAGASASGLSSVAPFFGFFAMSDHARQRTDPGPGSVRLRTIARQG